MPEEIPVVPETFEGIGYTRNKNGLPLESVRVPVPTPGPGEILIHVVCSSLNPLEYKLAELNFLGRAPPVVLGFDLSGIVAAVGPGVSRFAVGDAVAAMADCNGDGGWATGGHGGYALARECCAVRKPASLSFQEAAALPLCFIAAYLGLCGHVRTGVIPSTFPAVAAGSVISPSSSRATSSRPAASSAAGAPRNPPALPAPAAPITSSTTNTTMSARKS
jgi:NADPH:quinone reductase-like Zn-dependent oxidoreductase